LFPTLHIDSTYTLRRYTLFTAIEFEVLHNNGTIVEVNAYHVLDDDPGSSIDISEGVTSVANVTFSYSARWRTTGRPASSRLLRYEAGSFPAVRQVRLL
jgi:hypothetical protein